MSDELERKVIEIVARELDLDVSQVKPESTFIGDLGADSLDIMELVMAFEDEFNAEISDEDVEKIQTVRDAINFLKERASSVS